VRKLGRHGYPRRSKIDARNGPVNVFVQDALKLTPTTAITSLSQETRAPFDPGRGVGAARHRRRRRARCAGERSLEQRFYGTFYAAGAAVTVPSDAPDLRRDLRQALAR
jgi:hypothetical protein